MHGVTGVEHATPVSRDLPEWRRWYTLALLFAVALSNYLDRSVIAILQVPIKQDLGLSDTQLGAMTGLAFAVCYTVLGIPAARLADRTSRKGVLACAILIWSVMTSLCGFAVGFRTIFAARVGVAVGEAAGSPVSHALVADQFPLGRRTMAMAIWSLAIPAGAMLGLGLGGWLNQVIGWRNAFVLVGLAGALLGPLAYFTIRERRPKRAGSAPQYGWRESCAMLWRIRAFRYLCLGGLLHGFGIYAMYSWSAPFYTRVYHLPVATAGYYLALMAGIGGSIGIFSGGFLAERLGRRAPRWHLLVPAIAATLLTPVAIAQFLTDSFRLSIALGFVSTTLLHAHMGPVSSTVQSLVPEPIRAFSAAIMVMLSGLVGLSVAPLAIGMMSDAMVARGLPASSLGYAIALLMLFPLAAGLAYFAASRHLAREFEVAARSEAGRQTAAPDLDPIA